MKTRCFLIVGMCWLASFGVALSAPAPAAPETQIQYLSGHGKDDGVAWDFYCTGGRKSGEWAKIPVPSCWEQQGFGAYNYGYEIRGRGADQAPDFAREQGQYRFDFTVPADWKGRVVRIVFDGVMSEADVKINGQPAGPIHQGSFYRFKYDITPLVKFGEMNRLEVTVSKESANASVNAAERRGDYWNFGGIFRPVFLEALPPQFIDWTALDARADGNFTAQVHLGAAVTTPAKVTAQVLDGKNRPVGAPFSADVSAGQDQATLQTHAEGVKLWTAETPNLYHVRFTLSPEGAVGHAVTERFGFRTFEVRPTDGLYLNGQKIVLKGVNRHSFWPDSGRTLSKEICYDDVRLMKEANMNAVRMSHYPPDHEFLEACDELGLYVLDELAGWHGSYDTPTGQKLIGEMVRRDVNHPCVLFWDNGNEGGWNAANDGEFAKWDPQQRTVLHPWARLGAIYDPHYPTYADIQRLSATPEIFTASEILHGLYDGGAGAGLHDYWEVLRVAPHFGGAFIWAWLDEAIARTDQNGKLDSRGNLAPDGILGPHREKEGSYYTIKETWAPAQVTGLAMKDGAAVLSLDNRFDFTNLNECTFSWELASLPTPGTNQHKSLAQGEARGPNVAPHASGNLPLPIRTAAMGSADVLYVTAKDPQGRTLWRWSLPLSVTMTDAGAAAGAKVQSREDGQQWVVTAGALELRFSKETGQLAVVTVGGKPISLGNGPRFFAYLHSLPTRRVSGPAPPTQFQDVAGAGTLAGITARPDGNSMVVEAKYNGPLKQVTWRISPDGKVQLDYAYAFDGTVDLMGVNFDYPEAKVKGITWLGWGPYRVWQNRMEGTTLDVWHNAYNDTIPGETWIFPEFKGYFRGWRWAVLETAEGTITVKNQAGDHSFLGIFTPHDGTVGPLLALPPTGLAFLDVIPAMRDKFKLQEQIGPQSQSLAVSGERTGRVELQFKAQ